MTIYRNFTSYIHANKEQVLESSNIVLPMSIRVFTENIFKSIPSFKFPLKLSASTLPHSAYSLPFYFDKSKLLSYRVQAFGRDFFLNPEQRKYYIGYDLGIKQHLQLSSHSFINFKRLFSFGKLNFAKTTSIHFFNSLLDKRCLYVPASSFNAGVFIKTPYKCFYEGWHVNILPYIFRKRLSFIRKLHTQNEDLDLTISGSQHS